MPAAMFIPKGKIALRLLVLVRFRNDKGMLAFNCRTADATDLQAVGSQPGNYRDRDGRAAYRQAGLGDKGQIFRLATESIYVYWDAASSGQDSGDTTGGSFPAGSGPDAGTTVPRLRDLIGARAGQAENAVRQRGYRFVKTDPPADGTVYSYWLEGKTNYCVTIRTEQGRYQSIAYTGGSADCQK